MRPSYPTSASSPTRRPAASLPATPCSATSISPNRAPRSVSPDLALSSRPSGRNSPKASSAANSCSNTACSTPSCRAAKSSSTSPPPCASSWIDRRVNYPDSVDFLYALGNEIKTAKLGLERIGAVLDALGRPQDRTRIVHVAGTNGKGSTCAMIEAGLRADGRRTGLFTSPHLSQPTERIRVDGAPIPAAEFAAAFDRVHAVVEELLAEGKIDLHTTYFETVTAMALVVLA